MSEVYDPDNLLDRLSDQPTLELQYEHMRRREAELLERRLGLTGGEVLSVGCGWNPGRHLFPKPAWRMTGVELEEEKPRALVEEGTLDHGAVGRAGELGFEDGSFDVLLYRLVLHHIAYQGPLATVFEEAARLLRPGGALVAVEPGAWHPVGMRADGGEHGRPRHGRARHPGRHPALRTATRRQRRAPPGSSRSCTR